MHTGSDVAHGLHIRTALPIEHRKWATQSTALTVGFCFVVIIFTRNLTYLFFITTPTTRYCKYGTYGRLLFCCNYIQVQQSEITRMWDLAWLSEYKMKAPKCKMQDKNKNKHQGPPHKQRCVLYRATLLALGGFCFSPSTGQTTAQRNYFAMTNNLNPRPLAHGG